MKAAKMSLFIVLGTLLTFIIAFLTTWYEGVSLKFWISEDGGLTFGGMCVACTAFLWILSKKATHFLRWCEKKRIERMPEFVDGHCPPAQFEAVVVPRMKRCGYIFSNGVFRITTG